MPSRGFLELVKLPDGVPVGAGTVAFPGGRVSMGGYGTGPVPSGVLELSVPTRGPLGWLKGAEPVPVGRGRDEFTAGTDPLGAVTMGG